MNEENPRDIGDVPPDRQAEENPQGADPDTEATNPERNRSLRVLAESAADHPERCITELFLTVLIRTPTATERKRYVRYVREGGPHNDPKRAIADVFWVLLNSAEFCVNH